VPRDEEAGAAGRRRAAALGSPEGRVGQARLHAANLPQDRHRPGSRYTRERAAGAGAGHARGLEEGHAVRDRRRAGTARPLGRTAGAHRLWLRRRRPRTGRRPRDPPEARRALPRSVLQGLRMAARHREPAAGPGEFLQSTATAAAERPDFTKRCRPYLPARAYRGALAFLRARTIVLLPRASDRGRAAAHLLP